MVSIQWVYSWVRIWTRVFPALSWFSDPVAPNLCVPTGTFDFLDELLMLVPEWVVSFTTAAGLLKRPKFMAEGFNSIYNDFKEINTRSVCALIAAEFDPWSATCWQSICRISFYILDPEKMSKKTKLSIIPVKSQKYIMVRAAAVLNTGPAGTMVPTKIF